MYNLPYYKEKDISVIIGFMKQYPFAMLIGSAEDQPAATQVPLLVEEKEGKIILIGHIMRKQDHHNALLQNPNVLVIFTGPHTYVSATLYSNPHQASTWNYISVHTRGAIRFLDDRGLETALRKLTMHFENNNATSTTIFNNLPEEYRTRLMKSIIAFEIEVNSVENVFKLSQNRDKESFDHIREHLDTLDSNAKKIALEMGKRRDMLFNEKSS